MKNKNLLSQIVILFAFLLATSSSFAQNDTEQTKIKDYLESTIQYKDELVLSGASQKVVASDIFESNLTYSTDSNGYATLLTQYFIKTGKKLTPFRSVNDLLTSSAFMESMKSNKFTLNTEDDAIAFQSILRSIDNESGLGFLKEANTWYFVRSKFFDNVRAYVITTDKQGKITAIAYEDKLKKELIETLIRPGGTKDNTSSEASISKKDSAYMHNYLLEKINYVFEIRPLDFYSINKIANISLHKCDLLVTEGTEDMSSTTTHSCLLVSSDGEYIKQSNANKLLEMPLFLKSLQEKYTLKTEDDARLFQYVLDDLSPVSRSDIELKTFYKKDNMWVFVREKRFDDLRGYILVVNDKNKVSYMEYTDISEESMVRIKMKESSFKVDYKFKLLKPATNKVTVKKGEGLSIEISFDTDMVNAKGGWIMTRFDGRDGGVYAGSSIESPFTDTIPSGALENEHHTIEYFLLKNGAEDTDNALGVVKLEITVE